MSYVSLPQRLVSSASLEKYDVEQLYRAVVNVLGGTYYNLGVAVGPVAGKLDFRNFADNAGFTNAQKTYPKSVFCINVAPGGVWYGASPSTGYYAKIPTDLPASTKYTVIGVDLLYSYSVTTTGTVDAQFKKSSSGVDSNIGSAISTAVAATTPAYNQMTISHQTGLSVDLSAGDKVGIVVTTNTPQAFLVPMVWRKSLHV